jgi:hypothetical protein
MQALFGTSNQPTADAPAIGTNPPHPTIVSSPPPGISFDEINLKHARVFLSQFCNTLTFPSANFFYLFLRHKILQITACFPFNSELLHKKKKYHRLNQ